MNQLFNVLHEAMMADQTTGFLIKNAMGLQKPFADYLSESMEVHENGTPRGNAGEEYAKAAASSLLRVPKARELEIARAIGEQAVMDKNHRTNALIDSQSLHLLNAMHCSAVGIYAFSCLFRKKYELTDRDDDYSEKQEVIVVRLRPSAVPTELDRLDLSVRFELNRAPVWWEGSFLRFEQKDGARRAFQGNLPKCGERLIDLVKDEDKHWLSEDLICGKEVDDGLFHMEGVTLTKVIPFF